MVTCYISSWPDKWQNTPLTSPEYFYLRFGSAKMEDKESENFTRENTRITLSQSKIFVDTILKFKYLNGRERELYESEQMPVNVFYMCLAIKNSSRTLISFVLPRKWREKYVICQISLFKRTIKGSHRQSAGNQRLRTRLAFRRKHFGDRQ